MWCRMKQGSYEAIQITKNFLAKPKQWPKWFSDNYASEVYCEYDKLIIPETWGQIGVNLGAWIVWQGTILIGIYSPDHFRERFKCEGDENRQKADLAHD